MERGGQEVDKIQRSSVSREKEVVFVSSFIGGGCGVETTCTHILEYTYDIHTVHSTHYTVRTLQTTQYTRITHTHTLHTHTTRTHARTGFSFTHYTLHTHARTGFSFMRDWMERSTVPRLCAGLHPGPLHVPRMERHTLPLA